MQAGQVDQNLHPRKPENDDKRSQKILDGVAQIDRQFLQKLRNGRQVGKFRHRSHPLRNQLADDRPAGDDDRQEKDGAENTFQRKIQVQKQGDDHGKDDHNRGGDQRFQRVFDHQLHKSRVGEQGAGVVGPAHKTQFNAGSGHRNLMQTVAEGLDEGNQGEQGKTDHPDQHKTITAQRLAH